MATRKLRLGHLYPDIMTACGDRGNIAAIIRRCGWRGIVTELHELRLGDPVHPDDVDIFIIGNGGESQQRLVAPDLADVKGMAIREAVEQGAALLAVGAGYELLGRFYQPSKGVELPGVGLFDAWTIQHGPGLSEASRTLTEAQADRAIGDLLVRWEAGGHSASPREELLVGFESHATRTYLGPTARPLGQVVIGQGNNGDGREGVRLAGAVGTHMHGPCLPRNPALADFLIGTALRRCHGEVELESLADDVERAAHDTAVRRITAAARAGKWPGLRRAGTRLGRVGLTPGSVSAARNAFYS
jgi:CobQ-like glutamine amidotransferase family enzyme